MTEGDVRRRSVGGSVVDDDDLVRKARSSERTSYATDLLAKVPSLVVHGDDDRAIAGLRSFDGWLPRTDRPLCSLGESHRLPLVDPRALGICPSILDLGLLDRPRASLTASAVLRSEKETSVRGGCRVRGGRLPTPT